MDRPFRPGPRPAPPRPARFITPAMSTLMHALRTASAAVVVLGHARQLELVRWGPDVTPLMAHYAVIVFFVISGMSIAGTATRPGATLASFAMDRASRILPVALAAMVVGSSAFLLRHGLGAVTYDTPDLTFTAWRVVTPLLFLTESPVGVLPVWNPAWWSLSYEAWYYALFASAVFLTGQRRAVVLSVPALIAGIQILLLMPIWLMGVALVHWPAAARLGRARGLVLLCCSAALAVLQLIEPLSPVSLVNSQNVVADTLLGAALAAALAGIRPWLAPAGRLFEAAAPAARWCAGMTFTLYLFHVPLICTLESFGIKGLTSPLAGGAALGGVFLACAALAELIERRTPALRRKLDQWVHRARKSRPSLAATPTLTAS